jgi:pimeloyl-ACP methyl ester carboxylesterase
MPALNDTTVTLSDGRRLAYTEWGTATGRPVVYFHGTPGSRIWIPDEDATVEAGVRLIVPDRPGVGGSDPKVPRTIGEWPADVLELADLLGIQKFAIVGVSAGGSYAAACAALIPSRLTDVAIVSGSLAHWCWEERPGIQDEWTADDRAEFELMQRDLEAGVELATDNLLAFARELDEHPEVMHEELAQAEGDRWFFDDPTRVEALDAYLRSTFSQGVDAAVWEFIKVYLPWGFRLADIPIPVRIWHGSQDPWVTDADIEVQVNAIPRCSLVVWHDSGHLGFIKHWDEIMTTLARSPGSAS